MKTKDLAIWAVLVLSVAGLRWSPLKFFRTIMEEKSDAEMISGSTTTIHTERSA